jgi:ABC-type nitrate/sulfonate/bicarbonate transport system substrate-binding protein
MKFTPLNSSSLLLLTLILAMGLAQQEGRSQTETLVRVSAFPNAKTLPVYLGLSKGVFEQHGLKINLSLTESSNEQRADLGSGRLDVVHSAVDNALAMIEVAKKEAVIVSGGDSGMNDFVVQGDIKGFADMKGKTLVVDASNTAYALQAKKILLQFGLKDGLDYTVKPVGAVVYRYQAMVKSHDNSASILNLPFNVVAQEHGLKSLGRMVDIFGAYQAVGTFVMRDWAVSHRSLLETYLQAYIESLRMVRDPKNKAECIRLLKDKLELSDWAAQKTYEQLLDPNFGFTPDAEFNKIGFENMLKLRAEIERKDTDSVKRPEAYFDLSYYDEALKKARAP